MADQTPNPASSPAVDVLLITHNFPRYRGDFAGQFIWRLARELTANRITVGVLAPHHREAAEREVIDGVNVCRFRYAPDEKETVAYRGDLDRWSGSSLANAGATLRFLRAFTRAAARETDRLRPKVVHAHWWLPAGWAVRQLTHKKGLKLVLTSHGTDIRILDSRHWLRLFARRAFRAAHQITTVSTWLQKELCRMFPALAPKVSVIPMPVDPGPFLPGPPPRNEIPVVLSVARFTEQKRLFDLMEAALILKSRGRALHFRLVGEGALKKELHDHKFVKGLTDEITLVPTMPPQELAEEYRRADVVVLCSENEGFGMTLVEAQLCGRPVIGTRSGGITDIIEDGTSGVLVEPGCPRELADAIESLLTDRQKRERLAQAGHESANSRFNPAAVAQQFIKLYALR